MYVIRRVFTAELHPFLIEDHPVERHGREERAHAESVRHEKRLHGISMGLISFSSVVPGERDQVEKKKTEILPRFGVCRETVLKWIHHCLYIHKYQGKTILTLPSREVPVKPWGEADTFLFSF